MILQFAFRTKRVHTYIWIDLAAALTEEIAGRRANSKTLRASASMSPIEEGEPFRALEVCAVGGSMPTKRHGRQFTQSGGGATDRGWASDRRAGSRKG